MEKILYVSEHIPPNAKILLVDVETRFFDETDYKWNPIVKQQVDARMEMMAGAIEGLIEEGHQVYAIVDYEEGGEIFPSLKGKPHAILPFWASKSRMTYSLDPADMYVLEPSISRMFDKEDVIVVAGLWRELCVFAVARLLDSNGFKHVILSTDDMICFKNEIVWSDDDCIDLYEECEYAEVIIKQYEGAI